MTTRSILALATLALALTACGGSDGPTGNNGDAGSFSGTITGDISKSVSGEAVFGTSAVDDGFGLFLGNENDGIVFGREVAGLLPVGQHSVYDLVTGDEEDAPAAALIGVIGLTQGGTDYICIPDGGTVTVTSSTSSRVVGTLDMTAECHSAGNQTPKAITITGTFTAVSGTVE